MVRNAPESEVKKKSSREKALSNQLQLGVFADRGIGIDGGFLVGVVAGFAAVASRTIFTDG